MNTGKAGLHYREWVCSIIVVDAVTNVRVKNLRRIKFQAAKLTNEIFFVPR